jgi:hypothetical protein
MGVGVSDHILRRRRLLMLLAGFFGFVMTAVISVMPGSTAAEAFRANTAADANRVGTGDSLAAAILGRSRHSHSPLGATTGAASTARAESAEGAGTPEAGGGSDPATVRGGVSAAASTFGRLRCAADGVGAGCRDSARSQASVRGAPRSAVSKPYGLGVVLLPAETGVGADRRVAGVVVEHAAVPPAVFTSAVRGRGPPSITGS